MCALAAAVLPRSASWLCSLAKPLVYASCFGFFLFDFLGTLYDCCAALSVDPSKHIYACCFCTHDASTLIVYRNVA